MYRDGGSLEATFLDENCGERSLFLRVSRMPDEDGYHHDELYLSRLLNKDEIMPDPILRGSQQERLWLDAIADWIAANISSEKIVSFRSADFRSLTKFKELSWTMDDWKLYWLMLLFDHIPKRSTSN